MADELHAAADLDPRCPLCGYATIPCDVCSARGDVYHVQAVWPEERCLGHACRQHVDELVRRAKERGAA